MSALRARACAAAAAALLAAAPAAAYERTTDPDTGKALFWPLPLVPYRAHVDRPATSPGAPSCAVAAGADPALDAVATSFSAWNRSCADFRFVYAGTTDAIRIGAGEDMVVFRRGWCSNHPQASVDPCYLDPDVDCGDIYGCFEDHGTDRQIVALTTRLYDVNTGRIVHADIEVIGWDGLAGGSTLTIPPSNGWYFTCANDVPRCARYGETGCTYMDLQNTVTHEAGHFLGLAHTADPATTMYYRTEIGEVSKRDLSDDDVAGVCAIYPRSSGGCGSGGATGAGWPAVLGALAALAARRRR